MIYNNSMIYTTMRRILSTICILSVAVAFSSCKEKSIMDKSIYEDLTASEVININNTLPSFRFFYDNIRATVVANSSEIEKEEFGKITYSDMYKMIDYWSSVEYRNLIESSKQSYNKEMAQFQVQVDSVANYYRALIDTLKTVGDKSYPSYEAFVKEIVPDAVLNYISAQEGSSLPDYLMARNTMIAEYVAPTYTNANSYIQMLVESEMEDMFFGESALYRFAKYNNEKVASEFESMVGKYSYTTDEWVSPGLELPIYNPKDNYICTEYRYRPFFTGIPKFIMEPGVTYVTTSSQTATDEFGGKVSLNMEFTIYNDGTASGNLIERDTDYGYGYNNSYNHPVEGTWEEVSRHDKKYLRIRLTVRDGNLNRPYYFYVDEDLNCYPTDINAHPIKLTEK